MADNLHQGRGHMAKRLLETSSGMGILQAQDNDDEEHVVQRNKVVNLVNTSKPLPNTSFTSNLPYLTIPQYSMPMHTIYPQIRHEYLTDPNAWPAATLYQPPLITMPAPGSQSNQVIAHPQEFLRKEVEATDLHMDERLHKLKKVIRDELRSRNIQSLCYEDLCIHPDIKLPHGYKIPKFNTFDGKGNPYAHLKDYCSRLIGIGNNEALRMRLFIQSLSGMALAWYTKQDFANWHTWEDMAHDFVEQYKFNIVRDPYLFDLRKVKKMPHESIAEFAIRWRLEASKMHPQLPENQLLATFIDIQEGIFYEKLLLADLKDFPNLIRYVRTLEEDLRTGRLINYQTMVPTFNHSNTPEDTQDSQPSQVHYNHDMQNISHYNQSYHAPSGHQGTKKLRPRTFTPLHEPLSDIFERLKAKGILQAKKGWIPENPPQGFDLSKRCAYHSNIQGHDTEECLALKHKIQNMIEKGKISVKQEQTMNYDCPATNAIIIKGDSSKLVSRSLKRKREAQQED